MSADAARIAARIFVEKPSALRRRLATMWAVGRWQRSLRVRLIQGRESGCLHDRPPAICVGLDLAGKVGRREAADIHRLIGKTGLHFLGL